MTDPARPAPATDATHARMLPLILAADDLWSRYGMGDGQPFHFEDRGPAFDDAPDGPLQAALGDLDSDERAALLARLVERHLLPEIARRTGETPRLAIVGTSHNPVRDARFHHDASAMPDAWRDIEVLVTEAQVAAALQGKRPLTP